MCSFPASMRVSSVGRLSHSSLIHWNTRVLNAVEYCSTSNILGKCGSSMDPRLLGTPNRANAGRRAAISYRTQPKLQTMDVVSGSRLGSSQNSGGIRIAPLPSKCVLKCFLTPAMYGDFGACSCWSYQCQLTKRFVIFRSPRNKNPMTLLNFLQDN